MDVCRLVCVGLVSFLGLWTLLIHLSVLAGLGGGILPGLLGLSALVSIPLTLFLVKEKAGAPGTTFDGSDAVGSLSSDASRFAAIIPAFCIAVVYSETGNYLLFWLLGAAYLLTSYVWIHRTRGVGMRPPHFSSREMVGIAVVGTACLTFTLVAHRPDADDSFYVNLAVSALDFPRQALSSRDTMHTLLDAPIHFAGYRVHSLEPLVAAISWVSGFTPISTAHMVLPAAFSLSAAVIAARFLKLTAPKIWFPALVTWFLILVLNGDTHRGYGNFGFVRIFQGKAVLVTCAIPLLITFATEYILRPSPKTWSVLALSVITVVGLSVNGVYLAPVVVVLAFAACSHGREKAHIPALGLLTIAYPLAAGWLISQSSGPETLIRWADEVRRACKDPATNMAQVLGDGSFQIIWLVALMAGWSTAPNRGSRSFLLGYSPAFFTLLLNPLVMNDYWAQRILGRDTVWRLFWAVPLPLFSAIMFASLLGVFSLLSSRPGPALYACVVLTFAAVVPDRYTFSESNRTAIDWPRLKVPDEPYRIAGLINGLTERGASALAPRAVAVWIPTFRGHPDPVVARSHYLAPLKSYGESEQIGIRLGLQSFVEGKVPFSAAKPILEEAIRKLNLRVIVFHRRDHKDDKGLVGFLLSSGFRRVSDGFPAGYEAYLRGRAHLD